MIPPIHARTGFTLIELFVVIAIIGVLTGILLPAVGLVREQGKVKRCQSDITQIEVSLASYHSDFLDFPPSRLDGLGFSGNGVNEGNESLVLALTTQRKHGPYWEVRDDLIGNTDLDDAPRTVGDYTGSHLETRALYEILDPWGNPFVYIHGQDLRKGFGARYQAELDEFQIEAVMEGSKAGVVPGRGKYQIWSFGSNGENDQGAEEDDVVSWRAK